MNIIKERQKERLDKLSYIKNLILKVWDSGREVNYKGLVGSCCVSWGTSERTTKEYIKLVVWGLNARIEKNKIIRENETKEII